MNEVKESVVSLEDAAETQEFVGSPPTTEVITLPDGRTVLVLANVDSVAGGEPPPPSEPQSHVDVWWWSEQGEWVMSQTVTGDPPSGVDYSLPNDEVRNELPYVYHYTPEHTFGCEDHKPTNGPEFP